MKTVEKICRDLIIRARDEKMSISALIVLLEEEWKNNNVTKSIEEKEKNKMTEREKTLEEEILKLNEEMETLMSEIRDKYGERIENLKRESAHSIVYAETEEEKRNIISKFYTEVRKIEGEQIQEEQYLKRQILKNSKIAIIF